MATSRQRLLEYIKAHQVVTAADLSQALKMTEANARHHLDILSEQGLVETIGERPVQGRGRPQHLYSLSSRSLGDNLDKLAGALLEELAGVREEQHTKEDLLSHKEVEDEMLKRVAARILGEEAPTITALSLTRKLFQAVQRLNELHYQARWEARTEAPRVILGRCPYTAVIAAHPELCRMDAFLLERLVNAEAEQAAKLAKDGRGLTYCVFKIG